MGSASRVACRLPSLPVWIWASVLIWSGGFAAAQVGSRRESELSPRVEVETIDANLRAQFDQARDLIARRQWPDAFELLDRLRSIDSDRLAPAPGSSLADDGFLRYLPLRDYCRIWMGYVGRVSPEALHRHRQSIDGMVDAWVGGSLQGADETRLARIVEQVALSSREDEVLLRLGDFRLERGDFVGARRFWERIHPAFRVPVFTASPASRAKDGPLSGSPPPAGLPWWQVMRGVAAPLAAPRASIDGARSNSNQVPFERAADGREWGDLFRDEFRDAGNTAMLADAIPDSRVELADVRARMVLASILERAWMRARIELQLLQRDHADAEGLLGGRRGNWGVMLTDFMRGELEAVAVRTPSDWPTFAGADTRCSEPQPAALPHPEPLWSRSLQAVSAAGSEVSSGRPRVAEDAEAALSYHPVVVGDRLYYLDGDGLHALELQTGRPASTDLSTDGSGLVYANDRERVRPRTPRGFGVPRFTLHHDRGLLYGKLYARVTDSAEGPPWAAAEHAELLVVDLTADFRVVQRWKFPQPDYTDEWTLDGAPVADEKRFYFSARRQDPVRTQAYVFCVERQTGEIIWRRFVTAAETPRRSRGLELGHQLLTLSHGRLYFNSNLGGVAALRASDGRIEWLCRYPRAEYVVGDPDRANRYLYRDLNPGLLERGSLIVAPADCDRTFALDAITGDLLWSTDGDRATDLVHLLGVVGDCLIGSGDSLYWLDVWTGRIVAQFPDARLDAPGFPLASPRGHGRGVLVGDEIWFPTERGILAFAQQPREVTRGAGATTPPRYAPLPVRSGAPLLPADVRGNLVAANDVLVVAGGTKLQAFALRPESPPNP
ncbi:MAG: PQQ-like beta-propeller repeat protein [Planctomycetes bacterium]|nr:PQQ-like beta-propeller repeat protein [Planctomycetota bacterium]